MIVVMFEGAVEESPPEKEGEAVEYLQERLGSEKMQLEQMQREVAGTKHGGGGSRWPCIWILVLLLLRSPSRAPLRKTNNLSLSQGSAACG